MVEASISIILCCFSSCGVGEPPWHRQVEPKKKSVPVWLFAVSHREFEGSYQLSSRYLAGQDGEDDDVEENRQNKNTGYRGTRTLIEETGTGTSTTLSLENRRDEKP